MSSSHDAVHARTVECTMCSVQRRSPYSECDANLTCRHTAALQRPLPCMLRSTVSCEQVNAVKALGGEVRLFGESYTETQAYAWEVAEQEGRTFIAPYDDPFTVAGVDPLPSSSASGNVTALPQLGIPGKVAKAAPNDPLLAASAAGDKARPPVTPPPPPSPLASGCGVPSCIRADAQPRPMCQACD